jgi:hypothetical protein
MTEVEEQLRRYAAAAERAVAPAVPRPRTPVRQRRRRLVALAAAAAVVGGVLVVALDDDRAQISTDPSVPSPPTSSGSTTTTDGTTPTTAPATSSMRTFPVVATIECGPGANCVRADQYLVWSGEAGSEAAVRADGFVVDLGTGAVRPIPVAPIDPRSGATGVWTGEELIVCCGTGQLDGYAADTRSAAAWNPDTGTWRVVADPPSQVARSYPASVWTGELMVVVATGGAATYDPVEDVWREIAAPELRGRLPEAAWTGAEVILWDSTYGGDRGWRWSPGDDAWRQLPELPPSSRTQLGSMAWTGSELVVWGQSSEDEALGVGARWDLGGGGWRPIAPWPHNPVEDPFNGTPGSQAVVATDDGRVLVTGLSGSSSVHTDLYDPASDTWLDLDFTIDGYHPSITIVGDLALIPDEARPVAGTLSE